MINAFITNFSIWFSIENFFLSITLVVGRLPKRFTFIGDESIRIYGYSKNSEHLYMWTNIHESGGLAYQLGGPSIWALKSLWVGHGWCKARILCWWHHTLCALQCSPLLGQSSKWFRLDKELLLFHNVLPEFQGPTASARSL